ncbi:PREDICTED: uncharacterized protein LOC106815073 [Priapulus caudatus]|uniref:Uncharacterized protein LOC106815073 n=1 Tax=Priapulus caudatus TaxID=37621 RepID=A0ABM1ES13_PRICU|nr:PREDICTED: uncharacterized protein LOC106815073 [Priapulus caudatus]
MSETKDLCDSFSKIYEKALLLGLGDKDLSALDSVKRLRRACNHKAAPKVPKKIVICGVFVTILAILLGIIHLEFYSRRGLAKFWLTVYHNYNLERERCIFVMPDKMVDVFRPPVDCGMCRNVTSVDRVSNLSPSVFEEMYAYSGRPLLVADGTQNWTAMGLFTFDFFKNVYAEDSPVLENFEKNCQFFPYKTEFKNLRQVFQMSKERSQMTDGSKPWYIGWSNCDSSAANVLRQHYQRPYFLPVDSESSKTDWIFMGVPGYGAHMHVDAVGNPSWQAQISGSKTWTLQPPPECYTECREMEVTVHPGEIIVLDTNRWFHKTLVIGDQMSIVIGSEYN